MVEWCRYRCSVRGPPIASQIAPPTAKPLMIWNGIGISRVAIILMVGMNHVKPCLSTQQHFNICDRYIFP